MSRIEPVRKQIVVAASRQRAFAAFTDRIDDWWPRRHHIGRSPLKRMVLDARVGGRWYSICEDGSECDVGKVLAWEPPRRLVLAWQIDADWRYDPDFVTEVEVRFAELGPRETRIDFEHRDLERFGVKAEDVRGMIGAPDGWPLILERYAQAAASAAARD